MPVIAGDEWDVERAATSLVSADFPAIEHDPLSTGTGMLSLPIQQLWLAWSPLQNVTVKEKCNLREVQVRYFNRTGMTKMIQK